MNDFNKVTDKTKTKKPWFLKIIKNIFFMLMPCFTVCFERAFNMIPSFLFYF